MLTFFSLFFLLTLSYGQHAYCDMTITVMNTEVASLNDSLVDQVESRYGFNSSTCVYADQGGEFCGYSIVSLGSVDHFQHETPTHHYVDDITFSFKASGSNTVVTGTSKSEPTSVYDYDTNFCNQFNLFRNGNSCTLNYAIHIQTNVINCPFYPSITGGNNNQDWSDACKQCDTY